MGDEGVHGPSPFFIEGPLGFAACFEERPTVSKIDNFLPRSPSSKGLPTLTIQGTTPDGENPNSIAYTGRLWDPGEFERLVTGNAIGKNSNRYKQYLYWLQGERCAACQRVIYFDQLEVDRIAPGDSGPGYIVGNVQLLCSTCNRTKGNRSMKYLMRKLQTRGLP